MTLTAGTTIPDVTVHIKTEEGIEAIQTADYFANARVVILLYQAHLRLPVRRAIYQALLSMLTSLKRQALIKLPVWP